MVSAAGLFIRLGHAQFCASQVSMASAAASLITPSCGAGSSADSKPASIAA